MKGCFRAAAIAALILIQSAFVTGGEAKAYERATGKIVNLAVTVEFTDGKGEDDISLLNRSYGEEGLGAYIEKNSNGRLQAETVFVKNIALDYSSTYLMPRYGVTHTGYEEINPDGYDNRRFDENGEPTEEGVKYSADYLIREQNFVKDIIALLSQEDLPEGADRDGDGVLDALTVVPLSVDVDLGDEAQRGTIFWPHKSVCYDGKLSYLSAYYSDGEEYDFSKKSSRIGRLTVQNYLIAPYSATVYGGKARCGVVCHEFMHVIGAPDYYSYESDEELVGAFDVMDATQDPPQLSLSYLRYRIGWLDEGSDILAVEDNGEYSLYPTENSPEVKAYKIVLSDYYESGDCYYIENRKFGALDYGLIIYRVNERNGYISEGGVAAKEELGNMYGEPEVYVFRQWQKKAGKDYEPSPYISKNGVNYAFVYPDLLRKYKTYGSESGNKNLITSSKGENSGISVEAISYDGDTGKMTFRVTLPEAERLSGNAAEGSVEKQIYEDAKGRKYLRFSAPSRSGYFYAVFTEEKQEGVTAEDIIGGKFGSPVALPVSFKKYVLPEDKSGGYVYACLGDGEGAGEVYAFYIGSEDPASESYLLLFWTATGAGIAVAVGIIGKILSGGKSK